MSQPGGRKGTTTERPTGYGRPPCGRNGVFLPFRHSSSHVGIHRSDGTAYRKGRTDRTGKQRAKALPSPVGTIYAVIADAVRSLPKKRPNSLSPHDRNVQERPRPDRRTETSAPRPERPLRSRERKARPITVRKFIAFISESVPIFASSRFESLPPYIGFFRSHTVGEYGPTILTDTDGQPNGRTVRTIRSGTVKNNRARLFSIYRRKIV